MWRESAEEDVTARLETPSARHLEQDQIRWQAVSAAAERCADPGCPDGVFLGRDDGIAILDVASSLAEERKYEVDLSALAPDLQTDRDLTVGDVRRAVAAVSGAMRWTAKNLLDSVASRARRELQKARDAAGLASHALDRARRQRLLPSPVVLEQVVRYEAHLERCLFRTLHELERRQSRRAGMPVVPPSSWTLTSPWHTSNPWDW